MNADRVDPAVLPTGLRMVRMQLSDLDAVLAIEQAVYSHPWGRTSFLDSLKNNDDAWVAWGTSGPGNDKSEVVGYVVQMVVLDEAHLLTIAVKSTMQRQGLGLALLQFAVQRARMMQLKSVTLEVRVSNVRALHLYQQFGFSQVGRRKNYYQAGPQQREDALILCYQIAEPGSIGST